MQLKFNKTIGEIYYNHPVSNEEVSVFPTEDINHDAIEEMLTGYNSQYSLSRVKSNMEQDERLTGDEIDYIIEQLELFEESQEQAQSNNGDDDLPFRMEEKAPVEDYSLYKAGVDPFKFEQQGEAEIYITKNEVNKAIDEAVIKGANKLVKEFLQTELGKIDMSEEKKERKKREPKTTTAVQGDKKKVLSPDEFIQQMQEKINLTKLVKQAVVEITEPEEMNLTPKSRQLLIAMEKEINIIVNNYLVKIQEL